MQWLVSGIALLVGAGIGMFIHALLTVGKVADERAEAYAEGVEDGRKPTDSAAYARGYDKGWTDAVDAAARHLSSVDPKRPAPKRTAKRKTAPKKAKP